MTLFISSFVLVFLLGMQQQNVTHENHAWSFITSLGIALAQVAFVQHTATGDYWDSVVALWIGGSMGASLSMVVHKRFVRRRVRGSGVIGEEVL